MQMNKNHKLSLLIVEDEEAHALLILKNLKRAGVDNPIIHVKSGQEAIDLITNNQNESQVNPEKLLILLDLNIPDLDGFQVLQKIRACEHIKNSLIFILTSISTQAEIDRCYDLGCNLFIVKPTDYHAFAQMIGALGTLFDLIRKAED